MSERVSDYLDQVADWLVEGDRYMPPGSPVRPSEMAEEMRHCAAEVRAMAAEVARLKGRLPPEPARPAWVPGPASPQLHPGQVVQITLSGLTLPPGTHRREMHVDGDGRTLWIKVE